MEMDTDNSLEEHLLRNGVPPAWGELDLSQLRSPPLLSPPRVVTRRSRRRLSGVQPCSSHRMTLRRRSGVAPLSPVERSLDALRIGDGEPASPTTPAPVSATSPPPAEPQEQPVSDRRTGRRSLVPLNTEPVSATSPPPPEPQEQPVSERRTGRRSLVPLNTEPVSATSPPPPEPQEQPVSERRTGRRSLVPLNTEPVSGAARKSRRRSFGGRSAAPAVDIEPADWCGKENGWAPVESGSPPTQAGLKRSLAAVEAASPGFAADLRRDEAGAADRSPAAAAMETAPALEGDRADGPCLGPAPAVSGPGRVQEDPGAISDVPAFASKPSRAACKRQRRRSTGGLQLSADIVSLSGPPAGRSPLSADTLTDGTEAAVPAATAVPAAPSADPAPPATPAATVTLPSAATQPEAAAVRLPPELEEYYTNRNYKPPAESRLPTILEEDCAPAARPLRGLRRHCADLGKVRRCSMELTPAKQRLRKLKAQRVNSLNKARSRRARPGAKKVEKVLDARLKELDLFHQEDEAAQASVAVAADAAAEPAVAVMQDDAATTSSAVCEMEYAPADTDWPACGPSHALRGTGASLHDVLVSEVDAGAELSLSPAEPMDVEPASTQPAASPAPLRLLAAAVSAPPQPSGAASSPHTPRAAPATAPQPLPDLDATWTGTPARTCLTPRAEPANSSLCSSQSSGTDCADLELTSTSVESARSAGVGTSPGVALGPSPVLAGGGAVTLAALRRPASLHEEEEEAASPCLGGRLNRAVLASPGDEAST